ncbi:MAG: hypothetical protein ABFD54_07635 [Armatimonadota bacterium]
MLAFYWWSEGIIEASDAVVLTAVLGGSAVGVCVASGFWQFLLAFLPLVGMLGYVIYSFKIGGMYAIYKQQCQTYASAIQFDPSNLGAREYLGDTLYKMGNLDQAIDEMQAAVQMGAGIECQYKLNKWTKERAIRDCVNPVCRRCETENPKGSHRCTHCGTDLPYISPLGRWLMGGSRSGLRFYLIILSGVALMAISIMLLPIAYVLIPFALILIVLIGWSFLNSARW